MFTLVRRRAPSRDEQCVFELFAVEAKSLGVALMQSKRLAVPGGSSLDLTDTRHVELALLSVATAARQHLRRNEDLLAFVERVTAMVEASTRRPGVGLKTDVGLHVLRAIAMAELLQQEATRFSGDAKLQAMARDAQTSLASGFIARFGTRLPPVITRVFPRFADSLSQSGRLGSRPGLGMLTSRA